MYKKVFLILILFSLLGTACSSTEKEEPIELTVSAASSLSSVLEEINVAFTNQHPNIKISLNLASSGKLVQQIEQGAPIDVFLSANQSYMDQIADRGMIITGSRVNFASNRLVLIVNKDQNPSLTTFQNFDYASVSNLAIGEPNSVPAGKYAKELLEKLNLWEENKDKLVFGKDVRQVLTYVESGNVEAGIVYYSDSLISSKVAISAIAEEGWHQPIIYPAAIIAASKKINAAELFIDFLISEEGKLIFAKYGLN